MYTSRITNVLHESEDDWLHVKPRVNKDGTLEKIPLHKQYVKSVARVGRERAAASRHAATHRCDAAKARREVTKALATSDAILAAYTAHATLHKTDKSTSNTAYLNKPEDVKVIKVKVPRLNVSRNQAATLREPMGGPVDAVVRPSLPARPQTLPVSEAVLMAPAEPPARLEGGEVAEARNAAAKLTKESAPSKVALHYVDGVVHAITQDLPQSPSPAPFHNVIII